MSPKPSKAAQQLRHDHSHAMALFHKFAACRSALVRGATARQLCAALEVHATVEEELFYPALREVAPEHPLLGESATAHGEIHDQIARVRGLKSQDPALGEAVCQLMRTVVHHMADEETVLLPLAEERLGQRLPALGRRMARRRWALMQQHAGQLAMDTVCASPVRTTLVLLAAVAAGTLLVRNRDAVAHSGRRAMHQLQHHLPPLLRH